MTSLGRERNLFLLCPTMTVPHFFFAHPPPIVTLLWQPNVEERKNLARPAEGPNLRFQTKLPQSYSGARRRRGLPLPHRTAEPLKLKKDVVAASWRTWCGIQHHVGMMKIKLRMRILMSHLSPSCCSSWFVLLLALSLALAWMWRCCC